MGLEKTPPSEESLATPVQEKVGVIQDGTVSGVHDPSEERFVVDAAEEKKLLRKLDWNLLPPVTILYLLSFLDRSNGELNSWEMRLLR